jgi:NAD(P)-dependent dehydrogenase (short-subunit alcohol dehydrogenase family)
MSNTLEGKTIAITGAGRGLGRAYALAAASAGAAVVVNDLDPATAAATVSDIEAAGGRAVAYVGATNVEGFGAGLVAAAVDTFGSIDGVVANAGIIFRKEIFDESFEEASRAIDVNVKGVFETVSATVKAMRASGSGGSVVLITSGARTGIPGMATYSASKGAIASYVWSWALECEPFGIRVNAISPVALTEMTRPGYEAGQFPPEDIAPGVIYLLSDLSRRITGQIMRFTGGAIALYPNPTIPSAQVEGTGWTPETVAAAFDGPLAGGIARVGAEFELEVPLIR